MKIKYNKLRNLIQRKIRVAKGHFPLISNWKKIYDPYEKCNLFNTHFASVSTLPDEKLRNVNLPNFSFITDQRLQPLVAERFDVYSVLSYLNPAKCKGFKNLPNCLLKSCSQSLVTPLSLLFNFTLASEQFPLQWKTASILPFHKKGSHYDVTNHWPIALLPSLSKVFEKLVHKHLYSYLESNGLLNHRNSGFRKNHSTLTSLLKTTHDIYLAHDHNLSSHIVFLDISKAFDRVVHTNLLLKLKQIGIVGSLLNLITSYLENRSQVVRSNGSTSAICYTNCGVPHGSVRGPLLFLIYINDISDNIQSSMSLFADDTTLYFSSKFPSHLHLVLSEDLLTLGKWSDTWNVRFNAQKTKVLTISSNRGEHLPRIFENMQLQEVGNHKHLGLLFHNSLSWHPHIISLHQRAMRHVNRLRSVSNLVHRFSLFSIYNSFILTIFDYGSVVYDISSQSDALLLDSAQTTAAKIITRYVKATANDTVLNDISFVKLGMGV